jgi:hypothetical protein
MNSLFHQLHGSESAIRRVNEASKVSMVRMSKKIYVFSVQVNMKPCAIAWIFYVI